MIIVDYCETKYIFRTRRIISSSMCIIVYPESNKLNHRLKWTSRFHHFFFFSPKVLSKRRSIEFTISISYRVIVLRVNPVRCYILYFQALSKWPHSFVIYVFFVKKINNSRIEYRKERIRLLNRDDSVEADCAWRINFGEIIVSLTCEEKGAKFNGGALSKVTRHFKPRSAARGLPCVTSTCLCTRTHNFPERIQPSSLVHGASQCRSLFSPIRLSSPQLRLLSSSRSFSLPSPLAPSFFVSLGKEIHFSRMEIDKKVNLFLFPFFLALFIRVFLIDRSFSYIYIYILTYS